MPFEARKTALHVLNQLDKGDTTLDRILDDFAPQDEYAARRDRALFNALVHGVLRWRGRLDHIVAHFSKSPFNKIEPCVLNILRLGLFQIIFLDRIPDSAAVNTSVDLAKQMAMSRAAGFVNALLRQASAKHLGVPFPELAADPVAYLSTQHSFPKWLARRWLERFDEQTAMYLCDTLNSIPPITLRTNTLRTSRKQLCSTLQDEVEQIEPTPYAPDGVRVINPRGPIPGLTPFNKGWFQVQDEAAQLVALLLDPQPGESVLDACAGRGGKTAHIAQLMANQGRIVAMDKDETKLQQLDTEMQRLGISIVRTCCQDLKVSPGANQHGLFDRVLLDAPCSGLGVLRRNPDIKWNAAEVHLKRHAKMQKRLLANLSALVKPNGVLVYAVCSIEPEENEAVIEVFLKKRPEFVIDKEVGKLPKSIYSLFEPATGIKTLPILGNMDGFFLVRLKRIK